MCWYTVIIWWLPAVPPDIQTESSVDYVLIICWYTVIIWWLSALPADIQDHQLTTCWYTVIICSSCRYSVKIVSWPCINNMLIYSDYLVIIISWPCLDIMLIISWPCVDSMLIMSWSCVDIQWLSDDYLLYLLIFRQNHQLTMY